MTSLEEIEVVAKIVGIVGALIAAFVALVQVWMNLRQRRRDLRWKQSEKAKEVVDEWFAHELSCNALKMTAPRKRRYQTEVIPQPNVLAALESESVKNEPQETFIQDCFDALFYSFDRTEQFLQSGLIRFEDVKRPAEYYIAHMARHKHVYKDFAERIGYSGALHFLERFKVWEDAATYQRERKASGGAV